LAGDVVVPPEDGESLPPQPAAARARTESRTTSFAIALETTL
jgi:hypothetical protein